MDLLLFDFPEKKKAFLLLYLDVDKVLPLTVCLYSN